MFRPVTCPSAGCFAAWTYDFGKLYGFTGAQELYYELHDGQLGPYWAAGRKLVDRNYEGGFRFAKQLQPTRIALAGVHVTRLHCNWMYVKCDVSSKRAW